MRKFLLGGLAATSILAVSGELVARFGLGLGTPPLSISHPTIEYMFAPNQDVMRFGNRHLYNELGMRSVPLSDVDEPRRVLVLGDSVVNGGNLTDHARLATSLASLGGTFFGNVSAGSWGPANIGAWIDAYGLIEADTGIIVLSSHDLEDVPDFVPLNPNTHPTIKPFSALVEGVQRYLPRYLPAGIGNRLKQNSRPNLVPFDVHVEWSGVEQVVALIDRFASNATKLCLIQHQTINELEAGPEEGFFVIRSIFEQRNVPVLDLGPILAHARARGTTVYRDNIHLHDEGQVLLADLLKKCAETARIPTPSPE